MKQTVQLLREGWYGNEQLAPEDLEYQDFFESEGFEGYPRRKKRGVNCAGLVRMANCFANTKFIAIAGGLDGTIDDLVIDEEYEVDVEDMPIDMVLNLREDGPEDAED